MASPEAKNLEAISKAIDQHNANCPFPAAEVRMNPFEVERLGWETIRGLPVVPDGEIGTGRFRIVCSRDLEDDGLEITEAVGKELVTVGPAPTPGTQNGRRKRSSDQAGQGRRERGVLCTRATEDAEMRRYDDRLLTVLGPSSMPSSGLQCSAV
jgi:hypothetical protein